MLLFMYIFYGFILFVTDGFPLSIYTGAPTIIYIKKYLMSLLPIYSCYIYSRRGWINERTLKKWVHIFLVIGILQFFREQREKLAVMLEEGIYQEEITNNAGYLLLSIIPCALVYYRKPIVQYIIIAICTLFIIMAMKRGAILILVVILVYIVVKQLQKTSIRQKLLLILAVGVISLVIVVYVQDVMMQNDYFLKRIESTKEGKTSGRDDLYLFFWDYYINNAGIVEQLIGNGADGTLKIRGHYAHNDWLETLTNQGLMGLCVFFFFWYGFYVNSNNKKYHVLSRMVLTSLFIIYFLMTFFSMSIGEIPIFASCMIGFSLSDGFSDVNLQKKKYSIQ